MTPREIVDEVLSEIGEQWSPEDRALVARVVERGAVYGITAAISTITMQAQPASDELRQVAAQLLNVSSAAQQSAQTVARMAIERAVGRGLSFAFQALGLAL